jgi:hypothetical protein
VRLQLGSLIDAALEAEALVERRQADVLLALCRLLEEGVLRLAGAEPAAAAPRLAATCHLLVPLLGAEQDGLRFSTSQVRVVGGGGGCRDPAGMCVLTWRPARAGGCFPLAGAAAADA